jgi:hypothetical protein
MTLLHRARVSDKHDLVIIAETSLARTVPPARSGASANLAAVALTLHESSLLFVVSLAAAAQSPAADDESMAVPLTGLPELLAWPRSHADPLEQFDTVFVLNHPVLPRFAVPRSAGDALSPEAVTPGGGSTGALMAPPRGIQMRTAAGELLREAPTRCEAVLLVPLLPLSHLRVAPDGALEAPQHPAQICVRISSYRAFSTPEDDATPSAIPQFVVGINAGAEYMSDSTVRLCCTCLEYCLTRTVSVYLAGGGTATFPLSVLGGASGANVPLSAETYSDGIPIGVVDLEVTLED